MTKIGASSNSPKMSGISSSSRSYRQITDIRRPDGAAERLVSPAPCLFRPTNGMMLALSIRQLYAWHLADVQRIKTAHNLTGQPQPVRFEPF